MAPRHLLPAALLTALLTVVPGSAIAAGPGDTLLVSGAAGLAPPTPAQFGWNFSGTSYDEDSATMSGVSADGTTVVFATESDDLTLLDADRGFAQVVAKNTATGQLTDVTAGANGPSSFPTISDDGKVVAFVSRATNLAAADPFEDPDVYVKDLTTGTVTLISSATNENPSGSGCPHLYCNTPRISGNGQYVVLATETPMLGIGDTNAKSDIYRVKVSDGTVALASTRNATIVPSADGTAVAPSISDNGRFVAYQSTGTDITVSDANNRYDVFLRDMTTTETIRVSGKSGSTATTANGDVSGGAPQVSGDGHHVAYTTSSTDVGGDVADVDSQRDTYRRQVFNGATVVNNGAAVLMSRVNGAGAKANADSQVTGISDDGSEVLFLSNATNLGATGYRAYVRDVGATTTRTLAAATAGVTVIAPALSGDGSTAAVLGLEALVPGAPPYAMYAAPASGGAPEVLTRRAGAAPAQPQLSNTNFEYYDGDVQRLSADGRFAVFATSSPALTGGNPLVDQQVFRRDMRTGDVVRVSRTTGGAAASGDKPTISADGTKVAFVSNEQLAPGDGDSNTDAYVADLAAPGGIAITLASRGGVADVKANQYTQQAQISADGTRVLFVTAATNLGAAAGTHAYVRTLAAGTTVIADRADGAAGVIGGGSVSNATISGDGNRVAFATSSVNLGDGDADNTPDIHVRDIAAGATVLASRADGDAGAKGDSNSFVPVIARDGQSVAFRSFAKNLDTTIGLLPMGSEVQGFVRNLVTKTTRLFSRVGAGGAITDRTVGPIGLSADGAVVAFEVDSRDTPPNLAPTAPRNAEVLIVRTLATGADQALFVAPPDPTDAENEQGLTSPSFSGDGRCLAFTGRGRDIVPGVSPDFPQVFLRVLAGDCQTTVPVAPGPDPGPNPGPGPGPGPATEMTPVISALSVTNKVFRVGSKATAKIAASKKKKKKRPPVGTTFRFTLNTQAATGFTIQLRTKGRKVGSTCKAATKALRRRKACTRYVKVMALARGAKPAGKVRVAFSGKVGKVKLKPGTYRALIVAVGTGPSKKRSKVRQVTFTVKR